VPRDSAPRSSIVVDCLGFRQDKDAELRKMAIFMAEKAITSGAAQEMGPLNPYERRIVHMAVAERGDATSESIGDAFMKTVITGEVTPRSTPCSPPMTPSGRDTPAGMAGGDGALSGPAALDIARAGRPDASADGAAGRGRVSEPLHGRCCLPTPLRPPTPARTSSILTHGSQW
jgi:hypothetical protein